MQFIVIGGGCYGTYHSGQLYKAIRKGKLPAGSRLLVVDRNPQPRAFIEHSGKPGFEFVQSAWLAYLQTYFSDQANFSGVDNPDEVQIVPAPFSPHLMFDWLSSATISHLAELGRNDIRIEREPFTGTLGLPFELSAANGNHYISRAGWTCPVNCIEPELCPAIKGERDWDLEQDVKLAAKGEFASPSRSAAQKLAEANKPNGLTVTETNDVGTAFQGVETFTCHHLTFGVGTIPARRLWNARKHLVAAALNLNRRQPEARFVVATVSHCHGVMATLKIKSYSESQRL